MPRTTTPRCENCGAALTGGQLHCAVCGASVDDVAIATCPSCSQAVFARDRFCGSCGTTLPVGTQIKSPVPSPWDAVLRRLQAATVGEFEIKRELGRGGMAAVYLANDIALDLKVAIKVMAPGLMMGEGMVERFRQEAVIIAKLSHANIVRVHALRQATEDLHFIVMQYIPGRTLERIVRETGPLPIPIVQSIIGQVARALAYAHKRGVVHRDVKPSNIMLDATGDAVVTDFGIAKAAAAPSHTITGSVVGTPAYMSPEQCFARALTGASDQYSLGVVAFEMLTGQVPFTGASYSVMQGHTHGEIPSIRTLRSNCPPEFEAAITRMLAKTPAERFPSIADAASAIGATPLGEHDPLRDELIRLAAVEESALLDETYPTPVSPVPQTRQSVPVGGEPLDHAPRRPTLWASAVVVAAAVGVALLARENLETEPRGGSQPSTAADSVVSRPPDAGRGSDAGLASVRIANLPPRVTVGDTFALTAVSVGPDTLGRSPAVWQSSTPSVVRISSVGRAVALREGKATVSVRRGALVDSVAFPVLPKSVAPAIHRLVIAPPTQPIQVADRIRLNAHEMDVRGSRRTPAGPVTWSSANPEVATVGRTTGELVAKSAGRVVVSARTPAARTTLPITIDPRPTLPPATDLVQPKEGSVVTPPSPPAGEPPRERPALTKSPAELRSELDEVVRSYARAIEAEDLRRLQSLYPAMTSVQADRLRALFVAAQDIKLSIERIDAPTYLSATVGGDVRVRVRYRIEYFNTSVRRPWSEATQWDATLERTPTGWRIESIR